MLIEPVLTEIAKSVLNKRYLIRDRDRQVVETPKGLFQRVAKFIASAEQDPGARERWESVFYTMMARCDFEPNTPCLVNAGRPDGTGQLSACFVLPVPDSIEGIFTAQLHMAQIHKTGGGTGFSFSRLRPTGDVVKSTSGIASGPISFMQPFDVVTETIKQGGVRRGANMGVLRIDHPDIMKFIKLKLDRTRMTNFNVSVAVTNAFMFALEEGKDYDLIHPTTGNVVGQLHAPTVWKEIVDSAWEIGDPGLVFIDRVNALDPLSDALGPIEATNPCQPAWATVLTPDGIRTFADIDVGSTIWSGQRWTKVIKKVATGTKPVYAYRTRAGTFYGTENHRVVQNGRKIEARAAEAIDAVVGIVDPGIKWTHDLEDVVEGLVLGDGTYHKASGRVFLLAGPDEAVEYRQVFGGSHLLGEHRPGVKETAYEVCTNFKTLPLTYERVVPDKYRYSNALQVASFLHGLYSANGSVVGNRVTLKAASFAVIEAVQEMLSSIGISSYYTINKAHDVEHANGMYTSRESYDLNIGNIAGRRRFAERIGFIQAHKNERLAASLDMEASRAPKVTYDIAEIQYIGDEPVFDITVEADEHTYWTGGLLVSNCGEVPLRPYDACCLGSINLSNFYVEKASDSQHLQKYGNVSLRHGSIDFDRLEHTVRHAVRFLDNMLTVNKYPIPQIADVTSKCRKIGLGVMGWADLLIQLGMPYSSPAARELGAQVMQLVNSWAVSASEDLAEERAPFHHWPVSRWKREGHAPRRHATVTVIAPTGTISIIAGCSSGIEPLFALAMTRDQAGLIMQEINPLVEKIARREGFWSEDLAETIRETGSMQGAPGVPDHWRQIFAVANELDAEAHVGMQAAFQAHTQDAVSKCLAAGTLLPTSMGLMRIEDFSTVETDDTFVPLNGSITTGGHRIIQHYRAGVKPATRVTFDSGAQLVGATASHRVMTIDGWRLMNELRPGDKVIGRFEESHGAGSEQLDGYDTWNSNAKQIAFPKYMSPCLAEWLGMLCADGHLIESTGSVGLTCANDAVEQRFIDLSKLLFDITPRITRDNRTENVRCVSITSRNLVRRVQALIGSGAYSKHAPDTILRGSAVEKLAFLRGVTLDGYVTDDHGLCVYGGMSETLAYHIAEICRSFGLPKVYQGSKSVVGASIPGARCYNVYVSGLMQAKIDCIESHKNRVPADVSWSVYVDRKTVEATTVPVDHSNYGALRSLKQDTSRRYCQSRIAEALGWSTDKIILTVRSVEDAGLIELYDVEVEDSHEYVVNGVVSHNTINLRRDATSADVDDAYRLAWARNCKGITVYRDGCRDGQVLTAGVVRDTQPTLARDTQPGTDVEQEFEDALHKGLEDAALKFRSIAPTADAVPQRRRVPADGRRKGETISRSTPFGSAHVTINQHPIDDEPFELFVRIGKSGAEVMAWAEAMGRITSYLLAISSPIPPRTRLEEIARQLGGIGGSGSVGLGADRVVSAPDAVAKTILTYLGKAEETTTAAYVKTPTRQHRDLCPDCGQMTLTFTQRCGLCENCGYSKC